ncbi:MAG: methylmalonyl-CoA epimerase [Chloroflexota bacterium]
MKADRIDHTAIVVRDMDAQLKRYARLFDVAPSTRTIVPDQSVDVAFLTIGDTLLELIQPTDTESGVARFLKRHGEILHHIGVAVGDLRTELQRLEDEGVRLVDRVPRRGVHGWVAFIHPESTGGVLVELVMRDAVEASISHETSHRI